LLQELQLWSGWAEHWVRRGEQPREGGARLHHFVQDGRLVLDEEQQLSLRHNVRAGLRWHNQSHQQPGMQRRKQWRSE